MTDNKRIESNSDAANFEPQTEQQQPSTPSPPKDASEVTIVDVTRPGRAGGFLIGAPRSDEQEQKEPSEPPSASP
jgi:hypothetical protein